MVQYCTRETLAAGFDVQPSVGASLQLDRAIASASEAVEGFLHRRFYPMTATRHFDFPNRQRARAGRLWLDADELISATLVTSDGVTIPAGQGGYYLEPANAGPPYTSIELDRDGGYALGGGQRGIAITGVFGHSADEESAGVTAEDLDISETALDIGAAPRVGVGSILRIDDERLIVTERTWLTSGQTVLTPLTASTANVTVSVTDGTAFAAGETLLVDGERMLVAEVAGNTLTVRRAVSGTVLAAHTGSTIYVPRLLTVTRGALGTVAAVHSLAAPIYRHVVPSLVEELCLAYASTYLLQANSGWARTIGPAGGGEGGSEAQVAGRGLRRIEDAAYDRYGRKVRARAV